MPIFHEDAMHAGGGEKPLDWLAPEHLADWEGVARALDRLCPEQRCDAIYADWLLRLNDNRGLILPIRNLLIDRGALAANYLAELAQNADDASDGKEAHIRIALAGDWLLVTNNGRKLTSLNLLGLCRFFVHAAGQTVELNEQTIGRFGIGFKSCYRIASEVFVQTWDRDGSFSFRLPICREADRASLPDEDRLDRLISRLNATRTQPLDAELREVRCLGYCTPEFLPELPPTLAERAAAFPQTKRGILFCFHIRPERMEEVRSRMTGQAHEVYELCPLFLPNVRLVQLGRHELRMGVGRRQGAHDLPGRVEAEKVTLTMRSVGVPEPAPPPSCFWRLRGVAPDSWQVALHADGEHRLRVERGDDEQGPTLKDGSAYAFFPLNAASAGWPFCFHLHVPLPTKLSRDDWNPDDRAAVEEQLRGAMGGMSAWLEVHSDKWHPAWKVESLVTRRPERNEEWKWTLWERLSAEHGERRLVRSVTGELVPGKGVKRVDVKEGKEPHLAWQHLVSRTPPERQPFSLTAAEEESAFAIEEISGAEAAAWCRAAIEACAESDEVHRAVLMAFLGSNSLLLHEKPSLIEGLAGCIQCQQQGGGRIALEELWGRPGGAELTPEWHAAFERIAGLAPDRSWASTSVFGQALREQLKRLSHPQFNPSWQDLPGRLGDEQAWGQYGEAFWQSSRLPCPPDCRDATLAALRVPASDRRWLPISDLWLGGDGPADCFADILQSWDRPRTDRVRVAIVEQLEEWKLLPTWERSAKATVKEKLPRVLARRLTDKRASDPFRSVFDAAFEQSRRRLDDGWKATITEVEKAAVKHFIEARQQEDGLAGKTVLSAEILPEYRAALSLDPEHLPAPEWLTEDAMKRIERLGLREVCKFTFLPVMTFQQNERDHAWQLIEVFHRWPKRKLTAEEASGLTAMCAAAPATQRKDWLVGLSPQKRRPLREIFVAQSNIGTAPAARLMAKLLADAEWDGEPLPDALAGVTSLVEVCIQPARLLFEITTLPEDAVLCALEREQVPDDLRADPDVAAFLDASPGQVFASPRDLNLRWRHDGARVATLDNAAYAVREGRLLLRNYSGVSDNDQIRRLISVAETHGARIGAADGNPFQIWSENRETLRNTLLEKCVTRVGYEKHHILRELLQNAESAYASKRDEVSGAWFEFSVVAGPSAAWRKITARHAGRTFNERDRDDHERDDIARIWQLAAASERTPDEIGRFNRGFKSVFTVARDGVVHIRRGGYGFQVIDLLLLRPPQPQGTLPFSLTTGFSFEAGLGDTREMLKLNQAPGPQTPLPVLNASSVVFLRYLERISVRYDARIWQWSIRRTAETDGWRRVVINAEGAAESDAFLVFNGAVSARGGERRFAAAIRLDAQSLPCPLEKTWRVFRLTFETEREFCLDFLVNGDFEADQGRVTPQHINRSGLVEKAYEAVLARAESDLVARPAKDTWLAWAGILHLADAPTELAGSLGPGGGAIIAVATQVREFFVAHVPHDGALVPASTLVFPTQLMRRLAQRFAQAWGIPMEQWIDADIDKALPELQVPPFSLHRWLSEIPAAAHVLNRIEADLQTFPNGGPGLSAIEQVELRESRQVLTALLHPLPQMPPVAPALPQIEAWTVENLWHWWQRSGEPVADYTLDGANWPLLFPDDDTPQTERASHLRATLNAATTDEGRTVWYRLFGMACLMAAGRRMSEVRNFWRTELDRRRFWEKTSAREFGDGTDRLFAEVVGAPFQDAAASGENAHFWRRVFYDVRKIHQLVWQHDFPTTVLELTHSPNAEALLAFVRSGHLPGQKPWAGVFGQSAGSPLLFLVRELRRLDVIENSALDRFAFFACTPVRRAAERIGWLESDLARRTDFEALGEVSEKLHAKITSDPQFGPRLLPFYDIPLLHLGLNE